MKSIFVMIASYRDKECYPTLQDLFSKASGENRLNVGVIWQKDDSESLGEFAIKNNVKIVDFPWNQSKGLGWARSIAQSLYDGEDYILQLDSHHRFLPDWDKILVEMLEKLKHKSTKPLLTSYAAGYDPDHNNYLSNKTPSKVLPIDFKSSGTIWLRPTTINNYQALKEPINARFVSGHYYFTVGSHITDFVYDPDMYFAGDEITLSVRSYTAGYDLYHPHINVVWHHYGRLDRSKHWNDHNSKEKESGLIELTWAERDEYSKKRIRQMLGMENNDIDLGIYGLGKERSLGDFERYAGYDFKNRRIHKKAIDGEDPPALYTNDEMWEQSFKKNYSYSNANWPRYYYLQNLDKISHINIEYTCLHKKVVRTETLSLDSLIKNGSNIYKSSFETDNIPFKIEFKAMKDNETIHSWSHDTQDHVHWF